MQRPNGASTLSGRYSASTPALPWKSLPLAMQMGATWPCGSGRHAGRKPPASGGSGGSGAPATPCSARQACRRDQAAALAAAASGSPAAISTGHSARRADCAISRIDIEAPHRRRSSRTACAKAGPSPRPGSRSAHAAHSAVCQRQCLSKRPMRGVATAHGASTPSGRHSASTPTPPRKSLLQAMHRGARRAQSGVPSPRRTHPAPCAARVRRTRARGPPAPHVALGPSPAGAMCRAQ